MRSILTLIFSFSLFVTNGQEFDLPELSAVELSPKIQSPLYQTFERDEFDLLVKNVNVFASPNSESTFDFVEASSMKQNRRYYDNFYDAVNRQMSQYSDFEIEINNSLNSPFMDYHDEPIYSGLNRVKNSAYQDARNLTGFRGNAPLLYSPSLSARRGLRWY